jgi:hypothetical protein
MNFLEKIIFNNGTVIQSFNGSFFSSINLFVNKITIKNSLKWESNLLDETNWYTPLISFNDFFNFSCDFISADTFEMFSFKDENRIFDEKDNYLTYGYNMETNLPILINNLDWSNWKEPVDLYIDQIDLYDKDGNYSYAVPEKFFAFTAKEITLVYES